MGRMRPLVAAIVATVAPTAHAGPGTWTVSGEAGAEEDTNVERVETGPGLPDAPVSAPMLRFGARLDGRARLAGGGYILSLSDLTRIDADGDVPIENVTLVAGDLRWLHPVGDKPVSLGAGLTAADALPLGDAIGDRTFSNIGGDGLLSAHDGDDRRMLFAIGVRSFVYKPVPTHDYDWTGPVANARFDFNLWHDAARTRSLDVAATLGFEARAYDGVAYVSTCPAGSQASPNCFAATSLSRRDRFERAAVEATWTGRQIVTVGYQLVVIDSNSFGESLVRHRAFASITSSLPGGLYGTLLGILEIDKYVDGLVVGTDIVHQDFANIEDENRSSLQARLARKLTPELAVEARAAIWRNLGTTTMDVEFHRELYTLGVVYTR
jgi:hypothetical protein